MSTGPWAEGHGRRGPGGKEARASRCVKRAWRTHTYSQPCPTPARCPGRRVLRPSLGASPNRRAGGRRKNPGRVSPRPLLPECPRALPCPCLPGSPDSCRAWAPCCLRNFYHMQAAYWPMRDPAPVADPTAAPPNTPRPRSIRGIFRQFDTDNSNELDEGEFIKVLCIAGEPRPRGSGTAMAESAGVQAVPMHRR